MNSKLYKTGYICSSLAFGAATLFVVVQALQVGGLLHFPWDELLIYSSSLLITVPFLLAILALHYTTVQDKKIWSHAALLFTTIYVVFVTANYAVQLGVVIPATLHGEGDKVAILAQTPHSAFWCLDAVGYIAMGIAAFFVYLSLSKEAVQKRVRMWFLLHSLTTPVIAWVYFRPGFSAQLLLLALPWAVTAIASMFSLALLFKHGVRHASIYYKIKTL